MSNPRRITALGLVIGVVFALLTAFGIGAPSASAYGTGPCPTISVSTSTPVAGTAITVTGSNFEPGITITLILRASPDTQGHITVKVLTTSTNAADSFTFSFIVPASLGLHILDAVGDLLDATCPADPVATLNVRGAPTSPTSGGLASTGVDIFGGVVAALALLTAGAALTVSGRRKRAHHHSAG